MKDENPTEPPSCENYPDELTPSSQVTPAVVDKNDPPDIDALEKSFQLSYSRYLSAKEALNDAHREYVLRERQMKKAAQNWSSYMQIELGIK